MKKYIFFAWLGFITYACQESPNQAVTPKDGEPATTPIEPSAKEEIAPIVEVALDSIPTPKAYTKMDEATGDLNKDGQAERVLIFDTARPTDFGTEREIHIYKVQDNKWQLWHTSTGAVLPSEHGGVFGDPFSGIGIENGSLVIDHFGGSRQKWKYTHRFRFQNKAWQLIGATVVFGSPCDYWENFDYNLSTGKINYKKEVETCDENGEELTTTITESTFENKLKNLPRIDDFYPGNNEVKIPDTETVFYF